MQNTLLEFSKVLQANEQLVAGKIYYLTLEAVDAGKRKIYEAKIWVKPWMNFKQLQEFKLAHAIFPFRSSDLGVKQGDLLLILLYLLMNFHYECFFCHPFVAKFYMISLVIY
jgi:hypothetical protein